MSKEDYIVALDVGSSQIRTVVAQLIPEEKPRIIGVGVARSAGIRRGVVADIEEVSEAIRTSIEEAERNSGISIESAFVSMGGTHIECSEVKGVIAVGRADGEVSEEDVERVVEAAQAISLPPNKEILHVIPQNFRLDDQEGIKDPVGMSGVRLEMQGLVVTGSTPHIRNITKSVANNNLEIEGFIAAPLAAAKAVLNKRQKELGVASVDLGGGTTTLAVYEERELMHVAVLPVGAGHITNDIAIGLRTSIDVAEQVKMKYGSALVSEISKKEQIDLSEIDSNEEGAVSRRHVSEIIEARIEEIFYLVEKELKKINRSALLPAGVILTGGGACMQGAVDLSKEVLKLPAQTGFPVELSGLVDKVDSPTFAVSIGMIVWVLEEMSESGQTPKGSRPFSANELFSKVSSVKGSAQMMRKWFGKFLP